MTERKRQILPENMATPFTYDHCDVLVYSCLFEMCAWIIFFQRNVMDIDLFASHKTGYLVLEYEQRFNVNIKRVYGYITGVLSRHN